MPVPLATEVLPLFEPRPAHILAHTGKWITARVQACAQGAHLLSVQTDVPIRGGTSGGPVVTDDGRLLGVVSHSGSAASSPESTGGIPRPHLTAPLWLVRQMVGAGLEDGEREAVGVSAALGHFTSRGGGARMTTATGHVSEVDLHGFHPGTLTSTDLVEGLVRQAWKMGLTELVIIHGHAWHRASPRPFANTNTGYLGVTLRRILRSGGDLRRYMYTRIDVSDPGTTRVRLKPNPAPTRDDFDALPEPDF
jgi:hypothetical protein